MKLFRRILVPHDFSEHATRALKVAAELAAEHRGRLLVLHVIPPIQPVTTLPPDALAWIPEVDLMAVERPRLQAVVARALRGRRAPRVECRVVVGDPFRRIAEAARRVDSIVMATAGRSGLAHLLIGSVAEKVVRHAGVPVLTVRPARMRAAARRRRGRGARKQLRAARRRRRS
jgi:nucleotide-binding universal stress UspA family protein